MRRIGIVLMGAALIVAAGFWADSVTRDAEATLLVVVDATPNSATNVVNTDHTITATVTDFGTPVQGVEVFFNVITGPNTGDNGSDLTDANGEATFIYNGNSGPGIDEIDACVFSISPPGRALAGTPLDCDTVTKEWVQPTPSPSPSPSAAPATATPTTAATGSATPTATPVTAPAALPGTGGPDSSSAGIPWAVATASLVLGIAFLTGPSVIMRKR